MSLSISTQQALWLALGENAGKEVIGSLSQQGGGGATASYPVMATFSLAPGTNLADGTDPFGAWIAPFAGSIVKWKAIAETNPSGAGGGFTFDITKNGTSIFSSAPSVAANTTTVQAGSTFASTTVSEGDVFRCNISGAGTGVQSVKIVLVMLLKNG